MNHTSETQRGSPDGEIQYEELFGTPALEKAPDGKAPEEEQEAPQGSEPERKSPYEVGNPSDPPPDPPLLFGASRPAKQAYKRLHPLAWRYASDHMEIMRGVRKALRRAHKAAERAGGLDL